MLNSLFLQIKNKKMHIEKFSIKNFKSFEDVEFSLNPEVNIFTGINNSGKTTILEAISLWHECFTKLIREAGRGSGNYNKGQYVLGNTQVKYFPFAQVNSVRCPNFEDLFFQRNKKHKIELVAFVKHEDETVEVGFSIGESGLNYVIEHISHRNYNYAKFNQFFNQLPDAIGLASASPVATIRQIEDFTTDPKIAEFLLNRESVSVLRNRLYRLYRHPNTTLFQSFQGDLSYILFGAMGQNFKIFTKSDIQRDTRIVFNYTQNGNDVPKDIALLGSGSLQIIEILLNLYPSGQQQPDMRLVLLDEPDSHIHRDIQRRLMETVQKFSVNSQIFISTHNEAFIRNADLRHLFHLETNHPNSRYRPVISNELAKQSSRFVGLYPTRIAPVVRSFGDSNGLDFINALEADRLVFVEGEDDARIIDHLLSVVFIANPKKYAFWVTGGVSNMLKDIVSLKTVFSAIRNRQSLWEKSVLIFDRDYLNDRDQLGLPHEFEAKMNLKTFLWNAYTIEATLLTDLQKLSLILAKWLKGQLSAMQIEQELTVACHNFRTVLEQRISEAKFIEERYWYYKGVQEKTEILFGKFIRENEATLNTLIRAHLESCIATGAYFKLMTKKDVADVINAAIHTSGIIFDAEKDFFNLFKCADRSSWMSEWDFLRQV